MLQSFIDLCWHQAEMLREDLDGGQDLEAVNAWEWAALDGSMYRSGGYGLRRWIIDRLESLPAEAFTDNPTLADIRYEANNATLVD